MEYNFKKIEKKWQQWWKEKEVYKVSNEPSLPKCYVLDMFPYPSGAGLHVGHPLGYIASDIYARYKRLKGFNVLHPMGYDAFGLPAEQYAIDHGIHPAVSTENNINNFRKQLDNIGFSYDWDREVRTSDPKFYKWTQWIFLQLFDSFYNRKENKAERIDVLITAFEKEGNNDHPCPGDETIKFSAADWMAHDEKKKMEILMQYRLAYCGYGEVNWCEALGTVLANDEVINGVSERGGYPVVKKKLRQWYLRITEYADRLLEGLEKVDFSESMKEMQTNWIGKSSGAEIDFRIRIGEAEESRKTEVDKSNPSIEYINVTITETEADESLRVYTTRPDTIFGVDFMVIAPEHELVEQITTGGQKQAVDEYIAYVKSRSERERMAEKKITGVFTGSYANNPFNGRNIPIWISEYVLIGYGTGAIMAVPCGDQRDFLFAKHFNIPITNIIRSYYNGEEANPTKDAILENSDFLNGMVMKDAIEVVISKLEEMGMGVRKVNYKMRDAAFSRQRYWGEPFPIVWKDGVAYPLPEKELPVMLPHMDEIKPGPDGEGPLANLEEWVNLSSPEGEGEIMKREVNTMPGYAGSSWYFLRYMDPHNEQTFCSRKASEYWNQVDLYIGGTEHAVGHLLYSRMWTKFLHDRGMIGYDEPYKKLVNQGMVQGISELIFRYDGRIRIAEDAVLKSDWFPLPVIYKGKTVVPDMKKFPLHKKGDVYIFYVSSDFIDEIENYSQLHIPVEYVSNNIVSLDDLRAYWSTDRDGVFICKEGFYFNGKWYDFGFDEISPLHFKSFSQVEKMSKRWLNVVNPDDIVKKYGADTFRMYEMFLGPVEMSKPWDTKGIEGVFRFLKKFWRLFVDEQKGKIITEEKATEAELKVLHKAIKKIEEDTERFSFNTGVSAFMICVNELTDLKCHKKEILEPLVILLAPYAPHIAEELWHLLGHHTSVVTATFPKWEEKYIAETSKEYPISVNGKLRTTINISLDASQDEVEKIVLANEVVQKWLDDKPHKKIIYVRGKMVNVVV